MSSFWAFAVVAFGFFCFGHISGSTTERVFSFPKLRKEVSGKIDEIDGKVG